MKVLFIGGTGNISTSVSRLAIEQGIDLTLLNRGQRGADIPGTTVIRGDITNPPQELRYTSWDAVVNWIVFREEDVRRDITLFGGRTGQYVFISSASVYQKPLGYPIVTESTPLANPFWQYSRDKIACEEALLEAYRASGFPATIVRPAHTYDTVIPVPIGGGSDYTTVDRIKRGQKIIVHGDGSSLWTVMHATDFAKAFVGLLGHPRSIGEAFHITSDEILTWDQILHAVAAAVGTRPQIVHIPSDVLVAFDEGLRGTLIGDKATSVIFDNTKIKRMVPAFRATVPFHEGIRRTIAWFEADPQRQIIRKETNDFIDAMIHRMESLKTA